MGPFDSKWTHNLLNEHHWRRLETTDGDHELVFTMFAEGINGVNSLLEKSLIINQLII